MRLFGSYTIGAKEKVHRLLRRIYEALPTGGGLLIAEKILNDDKTAPRWAQMQNLNMLTCTEGKERSLPEYVLLLSSMAFRIFAVSHHGPDRCNPATISKQRHCAALRHSRVHRAVNEDLTSPFT